jgi:ribosomal protein L9
MSKDFSDFVLKIEQAKSISESLNRIKSLCLSVKTREPATSNTFGEIIKISDSTNRLMLEKQLMILKEAQVTLEKEINNLGIAPVVPEV